MTDIQISEDQAEKFFQSLWKEAFTQHPFDSICTLLRVTGMSGPGWDSFEGTEAAFQDYYWHLKAVGKELSEFSAWRIGLLMYCQAVEISAVHDSLANLLRIISRQRYSAFPLRQFGTTNRTSGRYFPPSAKTKWREIRNLAESASQRELSSLISAVFNEEVRNAFSHSDYVFSDTHFRWIESSGPSQLSLQQLGNLVNNSFSFFGRFTGVRRGWLRGVAALPSIHCQPNGDVVELLVDNHGLLNGFKVVFTNGSEALYQRTPKGVVCDNLFMGEDGGVQFFVGRL